MRGIPRGERIVLTAGVALFISSFVSSWTVIEREAQGVSVTESGNAFQGFGFFPLELGLLMALLATASALLHVFQRRNTTRPALGLCIASFVLLLLGVVLGPEIDQSSLAIGTNEARRGVMSFVGIVLATLMVWGAWQDAGRTSAVAEARK